MTRRRSAPADQMVREFPAPAPIHSSKGARGASGAKWTVANLASRSSIDVERYFYTYNIYSGNSHSVKAISMKRKWYGDAAFRVEAGAAKILINPFLFGIFSRDKWWIGCRRGEDPTQGGGR